MKKEIPTNEPITITIEDGGYGEAECYVEVDDHSYMIIQGAHMEDLDLQKVSEYVNETYYDMDYKTKAYTSPRLKAKDFQ